MNGQAPVVDGRIVEVNVNDGPRVVDRGVAAFSRHKASVPVTLALREPSLDDVFLALTGQRTEVEPATNSDGAAERGRTPFEQRRS